ncbi:MAG: arsenate reductase ArsC [Spirochaetota bacterium]
MKKKILFLCTHNSARSQIAEGLTNHYFSDMWEAKSAGVEETYVKPWAIEAMNRDGVDISGHRSKSVDVFRGEQFDVVVTVCDDARESCPFFPGEKTVHHSFEDPSDVTGDDETRTQAFCNTRDEIKAWLDEFLPAEVTS